MAIAGYPPVLGFSKYNLAFIIYSGSVNPSTKSKLLFNEN
jgi:hypothetical protein